MMGRAARGRNGGTAKSRNSRGSFVGRAGRARGDAGHRGGQGEAGRGQDLKATLRVILASGFCCGWAETHTKQAPTRKGRPRMGGRGPDGGEVREGAGQGHSWGGEPTQDLLDLLGARWGDDGARRGRYKPEISRADGGGRGGRDKRARTW